MTTYPALWQRLSLTVLLLVTGSAATADEPARLVVDKLDALMEAARAHGDAHGILGGDAAARLHKLDIEEPMLVDITTVATLTQPDCRRLRITITQKNVQMPGWKEARDRHAQFEMNYCPGGMPPLSADKAKALP